MKRLQTTLSAVFLAVACLCGFSAALGAEADIVGIWRSDRGGEITIEPCGETYCGFITKIAVPRHMYDKNKSAIEQVGEQNLPDILNKDPALRDRPLRGLKILTVMERRPPNKFIGELYNAEDGNTYEGVLTLHSTNQIELAGCVFFNILCRGEFWARVQ